jgi:hypothetical protein
MESPSREVMPRVQGDLVRELLLELGNLLDRSLLNERAVVPESPGVSLRFYLLSTCRGDARCWRMCSSSGKYYREAGTQGWDRFNCIDRGQTTITDVRAITTGTKCHHVSIAC